eukprot:11129030-Ditylum_brightwellii.AAC.1
MFHIWHHLTTLETIHPDYDMQAQIKEVLKHLNATWITEHVKGHQSGRDMSWDAQMNIEADVLANNAKEGLSQRSK